MEKERGLVWMEEGETPEGEVLSLGLAARPLARIRPPDRGRDSF